jgi:ComF family protein
VVRRVEQLWGSVVAFANRSLIEPVSSLFFPSRCHVCGLRADRGELICNVCDRCWQGVREVGEAVCFRCGLPIGSAPEGLPDAYFCARCRGRRAPFKMFRSLYRYESPLREMIHLFKFEGMLDLGRELGVRLADWAAGRGGIGDADYVVPVPLHPLRRIARGFNQSRLLAEAVAARLGMPRPRPGSPWELRRRRNTPPQSTLEPEARRGNVKGAFEARFPPALRGKKVLLIDDVATTETTVRECARVLRRAGAVEAVVITLARSVAVA